MNATDTNDPSPIATPVPEARPSWSKLTARGILRTRRFDEPATLAVTSAGPVPPRYKPARKRKQARVDHGRLRHERRAAKRRGKS